MMAAEGRRYRAVTYDEIPELKRAIRGIPEPFRVADVVPRLPEGMQDLEPRELGRALQSRGLCVSVGFDQETRSALLSRTRKDGVGNHGTKERKQETGRDGMKCHTMSCTNDAQPGSSYCEYCKPPKTSKKKEKAEEDPKDRVARCKLAVDEIKAKITPRYKSLKELDEACGRDRFASPGGPKELRNEYNKALKELRLAESDLTRKMNEEQQKANRPKPAEPSPAGEGLDNHPTYDELLAQYKSLCAEIESLGPSYGSPSAEEKKLKKKRLELRKILRSMAPLRTCWFCSGFSINNYHNPCREGALGRGDVPREACDSFGLWTGAGGIDESCLVAWPEFQATKKAEEVPQQPAGDQVEETMEDHPEDCDGCDRQYAPEAEACKSCKPQEDAQPSNYSDKGPEIYWEGGPIDTVRGMPWHIAVAECPEDSAVNLLPGSYEYRVDEVSMCIMITEMYQVLGPVEPDEVLRQIAKQYGPKPEPIRAPELAVKPSNVDQLAKGLNQAYIDDHPDVKAKVEAAKKKTAMEVMEENAEKAEAKKEIKQTDLHGDVITLPPGVKEVRKVRKSREYLIEKFKLSISEDDLQTFANIPSFAQRKLVAGKLRILPDADIFDGDFDDGVDEMIKVLIRASIILKSEILKEAMIIQRLAEVTG